MRTEERNILFFESYKNEYLEGLESNIANLQMAIIKSLSNKWKIAKGAEIDSIHPSFEITPVEGGV